MANIEEAVRLATHMPAWVTVDHRRRYRWHPDEDDVLREHWHRIPRPELAERVTEVLRRLTGDPRAQRTVHALVNRAGDLALRPFRGRPGEMCLRVVAEVAELDYCGIVWKAARAGELPTVKRGRSRYVTAWDWEVWLLKRRAREQAEACALAVIGEETVSKQEAMCIACLKETHIVRYFETGVIRAWKIPGRSGGERGYWRVSIASVREFVEARQSGRLQEILDANPEYVRFREGMTAEIRELRHQGRIGRPDPLEEPASKYHPGCFTIAQVASHLRVSPDTVYDAIKAGWVRAEVRVARSRERYAIRPEEARRYVAWVGRLQKAGVHFAGWQEQQIGRAGLLTVKHVAEWWAVDPEVVRLWTRRGKAGHVLASRKWGRHTVFAPEDIGKFEAATGVSMGYGRRRDGCG